MRQILAASLFSATLVALAVPASAEGFDGRGPSAVPAHPSTRNRTPLAGEGASTQGQAAQNLLEASGATGGGGQHS
ncbi:hypothetical protein [Muricoccus vinaceus]|uniref:Uncharacterized protein n=1 Tax=Muricoccus vinaceus TaxID=424704 RepID=A0ABV6IZP6_9PROT